MDSCWLLKYDIHALQHGCLAKSDQTTTQVIDVDVDESQVGHVGQGTRQGSGYLVMAQVAMA